MENLDSRQKESDKRANGAASNELLSNVRIIGVRPANPQIQASLGTVHGDLDPDIDAEELKAILNGDGLKAIDDHDDV